MLVLFEWAWLNSPIPFIQVKGSDRHNIKFWILYISVRLMVPISRQNFSILNKYINTKHDHINISKNKYKGKLLSNRNFILECVEKYAEWKVLLQDTKWLFSNMPYGCCDGQAVWTCTIIRTTWPLHCHLALWKSNEVIFIFLW